MKRTLAFAACSLALLGSVEATNLRVRNTKEVQNQEVPVYTYANGTVIPPDVLKQLLASNNTIVNYEEAPEDSSKTSNDYAQARTTSYHTEAAETPVAQTQVYHPTAVAAQPAQIQTASSHTEAAETPVAQTQVYHPTTVAAQPVAVEQPESEEASETHSFGVYKTLPAPVEYPADDGIMTIQPYPYTTQGPVLYNSVSQDGGQSLDNTAYYWANGTPIPASEVATTLKNAQTNNVVTYKYTDGTVIPSSQVQSILNRGANIQTAQVIQYQQVVLDNSQATYTPTVVISENSETTTHPVYTNEATTQYVYTPTVIVTESNEATTQYAYTPTVVANNDVNSITFAGPDVGSAPQPIIQLDQQQISDTFHTIVDDSKMILPPISLDTIQTQVVQDNLANTIEVTPTVVQATPVTTTTTTAQPTQSGFYSSFTVNGQNVTDAVTSKVSSAAQGIKDTASNWYSSARDAVSSSRFGSYFKNQDATTEQD